MNLVRISSLYHVGGSNVLLYFVSIYAVAVVGSVVALAPGFARKAGKLLCRIAVGVGSLIGFAICLMEVFVFHFSCLPCLIATLSAVAAMAALLLVTRRPALGLILSGLLAIVGFGFLFPMGGVPRVYRMKDAAGLGSHSHVLGNTASPLMVEFGDFECHACALEDRAIERIWPKYQNHLRYSFRHMPLREMHPQAENAAIASECAGLDGHFWEAKRVLFQSGGDVSTLQHAGIQDETDCTGENSVQHRLAFAIVEQDEHDAQRLGLFATPSLLIGKYLIVGAMSPYRISGVLDAALRNSADTTPPGTIPGDVGGCAANAITPTASCSK